MRLLTTLRTTTTTTTATTTERAPISSPAIMQSRSPWHSPVPYLFGGLAAMLGLIAFALLILACSYWRLSGRFDNNEGGHQSGDLESGNDLGMEERYEETILVIVAGNEKPTFLATRVSSRASSFGDKNAKNDNKDGDRTEINGGKMKEEIGNKDHQSSTTTTATTEEENDNRGAQDTQQAQEQRNQ